MLLNINGKIYNLFCKDNVPFNSCKELFFLFIRFLGIGYTLIF